MEYFLTLYYKMASVILQGTPAELAVGGGGGGGGVASVAAGTYMSNSGSASAVVLNSTLVAGDGIEISAGVLNSVSVNLAAGAGITITPPASAGAPITIAATGGGAVSTASLFSANVTSALIDLQANEANDVLVIPVPAGAQTSKIFKVHMSGVWTYNSGSGIPANLAMYCGLTANQPVAAAGDTSVAWTNVLGVSEYSFGGAPAEQTGGAGTAVFKTNECVFLLQNASATARPNLYFEMTPTPADGSQSIGTITNVNITATVEAFL